MNLDQDLTDRCVGTGADRPSPDDRRVAPAFFLRDTMRTSYEADKKFGIDRADQGNLAELVDVAEEHLSLRRAAGHIPVPSPPTSRGDIE